MNLRICAAGFLILVLATIDIADCRPKKTGRLSLDETFFMPHSMKQKYRDRILTHEHRADDLISPWAEDPNMAPPMNHASTKACPWTYVIVYNPQRIPATILEAVCSTQQCLAPHLSNNTIIAEPSIEEDQHQSPYSSTLPSNTACREVKYYRWVKVKSQKLFQGKVKLSKMLLPVTVACTCVSINIIPS